MYTVLIKDVVGKISIEIYEDKGDLIEEIMDRQLPLVTPIQLLETDHPAMSVIEGEEVFLDLV